MEPSERASDRRKRLAAYVALGFTGVVALIVLVVIVFDSAPKIADRLSTTPDELRTSFAGFAPPSDFRLVAETELGTDISLTTDCLRVTRYYVTMPDEDGACNVLHQALIAWGVKELDDVSACDLEGRLGVYPVEGQILTEAIVDEYGTARDRRIAERHRSIAIVALFAPMSYGS